MDKRLAAIIPWIEIRSSNRVVQIPMIKKVDPGKYKINRVLKFSVRNLYSQVMCPSAQMAQKALAEVRVWVRENELILHPDKTHTGDCRLAGQGFEFLGPVLQT
jgi:hypothetical protein